MTIPAWSVCVQDSKPVKSSFSTKPTFTLSISFHWISVVSFGSAAPKTIWLIECVERESETEQATFCVTTKSPLLCPKAGRSIHSACGALKRRSKSMAKWRLWSLSLTICSGHQRASVTCIKAAGPSKCSSNRSSRRCKSVIWSGSLCARSCRNLGQSKQAIRWQLWSALLLYVLLRFHSWNSACPHSFTRLFTMIRSVVWDRFDLSDLLRFYGTAGGQ